MNECIAVFSLWEKDESERVLVGLGEKKNVSQGQGQGAANEKPPVTAGGPETPPRLSGKGGAGSRSAHAREARVKGETARLWEA